MTETYDAIVIGGGLAGVTASRELQFRGLKTILLESRDRLGGRAWTAEFRNDRIEMGGQNVHWTEPHLWNEIMRYNLPIVEVMPFETYIVAEGDNQVKVPAAVAAEQLGAGFEAFFGDFGKAMPRPYDPGFNAAALAEIDKMSIQDRLDQIDIPPEVERWLKPWLTMRCGGALSEGGFAWVLHIYAVSGCNWRTMLEISGRFRLADGMATLVNAIFSDGGADLALSAGAASVEQSADGVRVTTTDGRVFSSSVAVVATSANMWSRIGFTPPLSEIKRTSSARGMQTPNAFIKLWALVRGEIDNVYLQRPNFKEHPIIHLRKDLKRSDGLTQVIAFSIDPTLDINDHDRIANLFRESLGAQNAEIVEVVAQNWVGDPHTCGGTSLLRTGQLSKLHEISAPEGRIAFCTADIARGTPGFDGAIETGSTAAIDAVRIFRGGKAPGRS